MNPCATKHPETWTVQDLIDRQWDWAVVLDARLVPASGAQAADERALAPVLALVRAYEPCGLDVLRVRLRWRNLAAAGLPLTSAHQRGPAGRWDRAVRRRVRLQTDAQVAAALSHPGSGLRLVRASKGVAA